MSIPRTNEFLQLIPLRFRPTPMPNREVIRAVAEDVSMGALEQAFCMEGRKQFKEAMEEQVGRYVQSKAQTDDERKKYHENAEKMLLSEKQITDFMLAFLDRDDEE